MIFTVFLKKPFGLGVLFLSLPAWLRLALRSFPLTIMNLFLSSAPELDPSQGGYRVVRLCGCVYLDVSPSD